MRVESLTVWKVVLMNRKTFVRAFCRTVSIVAVTLPLLMPSVASAHGVVGDRIFISPIVGNDAFPDNALDLTTRRSD